MNALYCKTVGNHEMFFVIKYLHLHSSLMEVLRANAQKNRANRGHSLKPNPPSFSVYDKGLMSL